MSGLTNVTPVAEQPPKKPVGMRGTYPKIVFVLLVTCSDLLVDRAIHARMLCLLVQL